MTDDRLAAKNYQSRFFSILLLDLDKLDKLDLFIYLPLNSGIDYPWIGEMFFCTIHRSVYYSQIFTVHRYFNNYV